jgi:hypothetical protein
MKNIILAILTLLICIPSFAQSQILKSYGIKAGAYRATQTFDYTRGFSLPTDYRWGIDAGGFVELFQHSNLSLLAELHYIQKGYAITLPVTTPAFPEGTGEYNTFKPRLDYLSMPIMAKVRYKTEILTPYIFAGPRFDFLLSQHDNAVDYLSTDIGAALGIGVEFSFESSPQYLIEGRFSPSFKNAYEHPNLTVKNKSFEILVGMSF